MSWTITAWARGKHRLTGEEQAVRLQIIRPDPGEPKVEGEIQYVNEQYALRGDVSGFYRVNYGEWAEEVGSSALDRDGNDPRPQPPGKLNRDRDGYTIPDEAMVEEELEPPPD